MAPETLAPEHGSFRDPGGQVFKANQRIYRGLTQEGLAQWDAVCATGLVERLMRDGDLVRTWPAEMASDTWAACLEHEPVPFLSWPYEWPFSLLRAAALHHLRVHQRALETGVTMADATPYNLQFVGTRPIFIDVLAFQPERAGEPWVGHRQFVEQFLNPLVLTAATGVFYGPWYRGSLEGIASPDLLALLPVRTRLSPRSWMHQRLPARLASRAGQQRPAPRVSREAVVFMLRQLARWIQSLRPPAGPTSWGDYEGERSYAKAAIEHKRAFVADYSAAVLPRRLIDLGCNTGEFAEIALNAGAGYVVGYDTDTGALERAVARGVAKTLAFLPLFGDAANPAPDSGWRQRERAGLASRADFDGLLALALAHHLAIGRNVPPAELAEWLIGLAPTGVVEFVPKSDPMVVEMLAHRRDVFPGWDLANFRQQLGRHARIVRESPLPESDRLLFWYDRR